jgi:hypothetical protein
MIKSLPYKHLLTLSLDVNSAATITVGRTSGGQRKIAPITGGNFSGERLNGSVAPGGADWVVLRDDGALLIDVRLTLLTDDGAVIYLSYEGRFMGASDAMAKLAQGATLQPERYSLVIVAKFECGDGRYAWLNDVIAVGVGEQAGFSPTYSIFEIG